MSEIKTKFKIGQSVYWHKDKKDLKAKIVEVFLGSAIAPNKYAIRLEEPYNENTNYVIPENKISNTKYYDNNIEKEQNEEV